MKIVVEVKANAKEARVERIDASHYKITVKEPPAENRANAAVLRALAEDLDIAPSLLAIVRGHTARKKIIEIR